MNGPAPSRFPLFHPKTMPISKAATPFGLITILSLPKGEEYSVPSASGKTFTQSPKENSVGSVLTDLKRGGHTELPAKRQRIKPMQIAQI